MKITADGRVTIPAEIRAALGFEAETEVEFAIAGDSLLVRRAHRAAPPASGEPREPGAPYAGKGAELIARLREAGRQHWGGMSTEDVMHLTRGED